MSDFTLHAEVRSNTGKGASRRLRRDADKLPAIVYGTGKDPVMLTLRQNKIRKALENEAFMSSLLDLDIEGKVEKVILKAIQRHPYKQEILHMDFLRVSAKEAITMNVPLHLLGEDKAVGVKAGGMISRLQTEIEIKCLPKDLPEFIELDVSELELDMILHLSDLTLPKGVELISLTQAEPNDLPVVTIHLPRVAKVEEEEEVSAAEVEGGGEEKGEEGGE